MNTELTFLMELFLEDEMPKEFKQKIKERIKEVESFYVRGSQRNMAGREPVIRLGDDNSGFVHQAPSMQRIMEANPDLMVPRGPVVQAPVPVTPAAAQALAARAKLMHDSLKEKPEDGRKSPRKF